MKLQITNSSLLVHTPAKINLSLRVLGRRADGFHELETLFASVGIYDTLLFEKEPTSDIALQIHLATPALQHLSLSTGSSNLIIKAAELLRQTIGGQNGARITLWKRIPVEAGLGGGSSDAAATLVGLNHLWGCHLSSRELHRLAAELGSDVNFFLDSIPLGIGRGRGEAIEPVTWHEPLQIVLVKPPTGLSTKLVFETLHAPQISMQQKFSHSSTTESAVSSRTAWLTSVQNDLEPVARQLNPDVDRILETLAREPVIASTMTGSGTACFALCYTHRQAMTLAARLRCLGLGAVYMTRLTT